MLTIKQANNVLQDVARRPNPDELFHSLWYEGEVGCLFADSNLGKSIYAVQIAKTSPLNGACSTWIASSPRSSSNFATLTRRPGSSTSSRPISTVRKSIPPPSPQSITRNRSSRTLRPRCSKPAARPASWTTSATSAISPTREWTQGSS